MKSAVSSAPHLAEGGAEMFDLVERLYPICRSTTGDGVRETLSILSEQIPLEIHEVPTGTSVLDWEVPKEWTFRDAFVKDASGRKVIDARESNLHVVNYSTGVRSTMPWSTLREHLCSLPEFPDWIPYRTAYFDERWGFCLSHRQFLELEARGEQTYEVVIDASHGDGSLTYGEVLLPGSAEDEVLISTHICHPSLANDNLSGIAVATHLARCLSDVRRRYTYRFIFIPATIGAITWLSENADRVDRIRHGLVLSLLGDTGAFTYKKSREGNAEIDRVVPQVLRSRGADFAVRDYAPIGYDERQFCSPGFNLPVGCLMRTPNGEYPEYHTSADNLDLVQASSLAESLATCVAVTRVLEHNDTYVNQKPRGEPRLGPLGLYNAYGTAESKQLMQQAVLWTLNLSDGRYDLLSVAERSGLPFEAIHEAASALCGHDLLRQVTLGPRPVTGGSSVETEPPVLQPHLRRLG